MIQALINNKKTSYLEDLFSHISSVQALSHIWFFLTPWTIAHQASCPSPTPRVYPNSCPLSQWSIPTISSSVVPFSSCLQSFLTSGSFQMSRLFTSGGQNIGVSASTSVLPVNIQDFRMDWLDLLAVQWTLKSLLQHHSSKASILWPLAFFIVQLSHAYMTTGKNIAMTRWTFVDKVMSLLFIYLFILSLLFNMLSNFNF